jgi:hypothetical protein
MSETDFGNSEERAVALRVALACKELNEAISHAQHIGIFVKVADLAADCHESNLQVRIMERRTMILPTALEGE